MYEALKVKTESIADKYADLIEKRLDMALGDEIDLSHAMEEIEGGVKMLAYLSNALDRMNHINPVTG